MSVTNLILDGLSEEEIIDKLDNLPLFEKANITGMLGVMRIIPQGFIFIFEEGQDKVVSQFVPGTAKQSLEKGVL